MSFTSSSTRSAGYPRAGEGAQRGAGPRGHLIPSSRKWKGRSCGGLAAALVLVGTGTAVAFPPARPFDPRLLMPKVEARAKHQGHFRFVVLGDSKNNPPFTAVLEQAAALKPDLALSTGDLVDKGAGRRAPRSTIG